MLMGLVSVERCSHEPAGTVFVKLAAAAGVKVMTMDDFYMNFQRQTSILHGWGEDLWVDSKLLAIANSIESRDVRKSAAYRRLLFAKLKRREPRGNQSFDSFVTFN
jgi:hypothetical protein